MVFLRMYACRACFMSLSTALYSSIDLFASGLPTASLVLLVPVALVNCSFCKDYGRLSVLTGVCTYTPLFKQDKIMQIRRV